MATSASAGNLESLQSLHDQAEYLLNDQLGYAAALKSSRHTTVTLLLAVVGIGLFRVDLFRAANQVLVVPIWAAWTIGSCIMLALFCLLCGGYLVYTERSLLKEFQAKPKAASGGGGALGVLYLRDELIDGFAQQTPEEVMRMRVDGLRLAYQKLSVANRRVRGRLSYGTAWLFTGLLLVFGAFSVYTVGGLADAQASEGGENVKHEGENVVIPGEGR